MAQQKAAGAQKGASYRGRQDSRASVFPVDSAPSPLRGHGVPLITLSDTLAFWKDRRSAIIVYADNNIFMIAWNSHFLLNCRGEIIQKLVT
jgi:hypothetical protein